MLLRIEVSADADPNYGSGRRFRRAVTQDVLSSVAARAKQEQIDLNRVQIVKAKKAGASS